MTAMIDIHDGKGMSDAKFARFAEFVTERLGIKMPDKKKVMLQCRLTRRIRDLKMGSFDEYYNYVFKHGGLESELQNFINAVTTNKTEFFREPKHFEILTNEALPTLEREGSLRDRNLKLWCAGCSSGEEPYTLAITLREHAETHAGFNFVILATDVSTKVLDVAREAIYDLRKVDAVTLEQKRKYLLKSRDQVRPKARVVPALRAKVRFHQLNFMDESYGVPGGFHVIFFRNVMIYFDRSTQEKVINRMAEKIVPGGYLFTGHAESLRDLKIPFKMVANAVYRKTN